MSLSKLQEIVRDRETCILQSTGSQGWTRLSDRTVTTEFGSLVPGGCKEVRKKAAWQVL